MSRKANLDLIKFAKKTLGELSEEVVFVGGITACLYVDEKTAEPPRPTEDVDCVLEINHLNGYSDFEAKLRAKGFRNDTRPRAPICRYLYGELLVLDVMPADPEILGFSNKWYQLGIEHKVRFYLADGEIYIFPLDLFIASKFEAYLGRGKSDPRMSSDLEDIVSVVDGCPQLVSTTADLNLKEYLKSMSTEMLQDDRLVEAISGFLNNDQDKIIKCQTRLQKFSSSF
jgi:hypothetical protein